MSAGPGNYNTCIYLARELESEPTLLWRWQCVLNPGSHHMRAKSHSEVWVHHRCHFPLQCNKVDCVVFMRVLAIVVSR